MKWRRLGAEDTLRDAEVAELERTQSVYAQTAEALAVRVLKNEAELWRAEGDGVDLLLEVAVADYPRGRECTVGLMLGTGLRTHLPEVVAWVDSYARTAGAQWVSMTSHRKGWDRFFERYATPVARVWVRELK